LHGRFDDALPFFTALGEARIPNFEKTRVQESLKDDTGAPRVLTGTITAARPSCGFIESDSPKMRVFVQMSELGSIDLKDFLVGFPVAFELTFTMRGPLARNLRSMI
jgi:cold shock CspA family protein